MKYSTALEASEVSADFPIRENLVRKYKEKREGSSKQFMSYAVISVIYKLIHCFSGTTLSKVFPHCKPPDWYEHNEK